MSEAPDGERVRSLREQRGWTQDGLAARAVIDVQTLRRIERGGRVRRRSLLRVAQALGLTIEELQQPAAPQQDAPSAGRLRQALVAECGETNLLGGIFLDQDLPLHRFAVERSLEVSGGLETFSPGDLLRDSRDTGPGRWVIVGDAGAGKTTLLRVLGLKLAADPHAPCPVYLRLLELPLDDPRPEVLLGSVASEERELVARLADEGRVVFLLDGLDEVPPSGRARIRSLLKVAAARWPCPLLVTSRPFGLRRPGGFELARLLPLDDGQITEFLERWFDQRGEGPSGAELTPELLESARTPLLLVIVALLIERGAHDPYSERPHTRAQLYAQGLDVLLAGMHRPEGAPRIESDVQCALDALAKAAHLLTSQQTLALSTRELASRLRSDDALWERLARVERWAGGPEAFLEEIAELSGVLAPHDGRGTQVRFWHRSFQELLTARELARRPHDELLAEAESLRRDGDMAHWVEPYTLLAGELERADDFLDALYQADPEIAVRALENARHVGSGTLQELVSELHNEDDPRPQARTLIEGMRSWWSSVGDSARAGLVTATEYKAGAWLAGHPDALAKLQKLLEALGRTPQDPIEVDDWLAELVHSLPCDRRMLRGRIYLQLGRLLEPRQAIELAEAFWEGALERGSYGDDLFFLHDLLTRLGKEHVAARRALAALYEDLGTPPAELLEWASIPAGEFVMGDLAESGGFPWERPRHRVRFPRGWEAARTTVTRAQYARFDPSACPFDADDPQEARRPAEGLSWYACVAFCRWLSHHAGAGSVIRLPREAEWEYMARAGTETRYWSGDEEADLDRVGWYRENAEGRTHPVGLKPANPWGLFDVHGNTWEWTQDWYGAYPEADQQDPRGASSGTCRVMRGGCFQWDAPWARSSHRSWLPAHSRIENIAFRPVRCPL